MRPASGMADGAFTLRHKKGVWGLGVVRYTP